MRLLCRTRPRLSRQSRALSLCTFRRVFRAGDSVDGRAAPPPHSCQFSWFSFASTSRQHRRRHREQGSGFALEADPGSPRRRSPLRLLWSTLPPEGRSPPVSPTRTARFVRRCRICGTGGCRDARSAGARMDAAPQPLPLRSGVHNKKNVSAASSLRENIPHRCRQINGVHFHPVKLLILS